ncbi:MAG TPA: aerobic carbon-monoxide dehydrogenase large subunit [Acidimicrobiales bacterium]|nr:aerobic carbon-monoxide dehydrogenase large subunit [Acidimicrobiales bacterium]
MTTQWFGERVERREDQRLLTGTGRFLDDAGHDALAVAFVRSPYAHARITGVDVADTLDVDGLVGIYTWDDLPGRLADPLPLLIPHPDLTQPRTQYALAHGEVNHVGEAIVMVVAVDRYVAEDVADRIVVDYEALPAVVGLDAARRAEHLVHHDVPGNVAAVTTQELGDARAAIAAAPRMLELDLAMERSLSSPLEGRGVHARWDADDQRLRIRTSTQTSTGVRAAVANILELPDVAVEVITPDVGGGFGTKVLHPYPEEVLVPWAARLLGREVKWVEDRYEHFVSATHERGQQHHVRVGFDDDGVILGLEVEFWHDTGAYSPYGIVLPIITATQLPGPYRHRHYRVTFTSLYTNTVTCTPYRGAGRPQGCFVMERTVDRIAAELGLDRTEVRSRNLIGPDEFPYDLQMTFQDGRPLIYDSGDYPAALERIKELVGWDGFAAEQEAAAAEGRHLGIGLACYVEGTGVGPYEGGHVHVETNGRVMVATGLTSQGQGHETVLAQIVADELGVDMADVYVTTGDTRRFPYAVGTYASRAAVMSGNAVALAARAVRAKAVRVAADALEAAPDDIEIAGGIASVRGTPSRGIPLSQVAVLSNPLRYSFSKEAQAATQFAAPADPDVAPVPDDEEPGLEARDYYSPVRSTFASGIHAAVVEVDRATGTVDVLRYAVVHDCGRLINPMIVEGQIHGGVAQGVAGALLERLVYDDAGNLNNATFMDFLMPYVSEVPPMAIAHLETPSPLNPLGIKGAGEAGVIPGSACLAAAIEDAVGVRIERMPISPPELWAQLQEHSLKENAPYGVISLQRRPT